MKVISSSEVPKLIKDGDIFLIPGVTGAFAEETIMEMEKYFLETGHPRNLKLYWQAAMGDMNTRGLSHLCHEGLFNYVVAGHINGCGHKMTEFCRDNKAEVYNFPQGVCIQLMRAVAANTPGVLTKIGLKTFMDPRIDCGRMNAAAKDSLIELMNIDGEEWLLYKAPKKIDVAVIRGTYADENGNITMEREGYKLGQLAAAEAAKATGGIVICQVERVVKAGTMNPRFVKVPGILVDYVYEAKPEYHWQTSATYFNPVFTGDIKVPLDSLPTVSLDEKKVIARRAAMELRKGNLVNLGVGTPTFISNIAAEEGCSDKFTLTSETGSIGGIPGSGHDFGCAWNGEAIIESADMFDMYDGGSLDVGCLGFLEIGPNGNLNSSNRNGLGIGVGGFMNVAGGAKKVVFMGAMTAGEKHGEGPVYQIGAGKIKIKKEGTCKKFINNIAQISFSGEVALDEHKEVLYITERAVFRLTREGLKLIEIAPGVDLKKDILDQMEFAPVVADDLKEMPAEIFEEKWGGLSAIMDE